MIQTLLQHTAQRCYPAKKRLFLAFWLFDCLRTCWGFTEPLKTAAKACFSCASASDPIKRAFHQAQILADGNRNRRRPACHMSGWTCHLASGRPCSAKDVGLDTVTSATTLLDTENTPEESSFSNELQSVCWKPVATCVLQQELSSVLVTRTAFELVGLSRGFPYCGTKVQHKARDFRFICFPLNEAPKRSCGV